MVRENGQKMNNGKYTKAFRSMLTTGMAFIVNYGINLVLTPYLTNHVGTEGYGFVSLARQFAQYASILTMALDSFAARHIAVEYYKGDRKRANVFFSSAFFGDLLLSSGIMAVVVFAVFFLERVLNISQEIVADVKLLFLFVFLNFWITTTFAVFATSAYIKNKLDVVGVFKGLSYGMEALVLLLAYTLLPARVFYVGVGLMAAALVIACSNVWLCKKYTPELSVRKKNFSVLAVKRLVVDGIWNSVNSLGELLNSGLDLVICNLMLSATAMGQLAIAKTIYSIFGSLFSMISQAFQPMLLKSYAKDDRENLLQELRFSMKISGLFSNVGFAGFTALGLAFYQLWIPNQDIRQIYWLTVITILTVIPGGPMQPLYYIYTLTVKKMFPCLVTIAGGVLNVVSMYFLISYTRLGVYAVAWTTAIVMMVINFVTNPLYMAHVLHLPWHTFYPNIIRNVISCSFLTGVFWIFSRLYMPNSWAALVLNILVFFLLGAGMHLMIVCDGGDWDKIKRYVKKRGAEKDA